MTTKKPMQRTGFKAKPAVERAFPVKREPKRRQRKCSIAACRKPFEPRSMTHKTCSPECAQLHVEQEKARKLKRERQEGLAKLKRRADYLADAQQAFNAWVRFRDREQPCICCGSMTAGGSGMGGGWDAGHWISRGHASHLRFDERNVHKQRKGCNRPGGTTRAKFRIGLAARIGEDAVRSLEAIEYAPSEKKWSIDECKAITAEYRRKLRELKRYCT